MTYKERVAMLTTLSPYSSVFLAFFLQTLAKLHSMIASNLKPPETLPSFAWQEKKERRRRLLEAVRYRRRRLSCKLQQHRKAVKSGSF
jgi:hypothetical protein